MRMITTTRCFTFHLQSELLAHSQEMVFDFRPLIACLHVADRSSDGFDVLRVLVQVRVQQEPFLKDFFRSEMRSPIAQAFANEIVETGKFVVHISRHGQVTSRCCSVTRVPDDHTSRAMRGARVLRSLRIQSPHTPL